MDSPRSTPISAAALLVGALATIALGTRPPPEHRPVEPIGRPTRARPIEVGPIDLNAAGVAELDSLPRVGPALASRIIAHRTEIGGFRAIDDLDAVSGVGPALLAKLRPLVRVGTASPASQNRSSNQPILNPTPSVSRPAIASSRNE